MSMNEQTKRPEISGQSAFPAKSLHGKYKSKITRRCFNILC